MIDEAMEATLIIILLTAVGTFGWYAVGILVRGRCDRRLGRRFHRQGVLALTYDDGPGPATTPELLDLLADQDAKATFFLIGRSAEQAPQLVSRIADEGHTIAWHTQVHRNQWKTDPVRGLADLRLPSALREPPGGRIRLFRPPYGKMTLGTALACLCSGWRIITWTRPSGDTLDPLPDVDEFVQQIDDDGGGVVLMHDMDRDDPARARFVLDSTAALIRLARRRGWRIIHSPEDWGRFS
ncbi:MAG: polysaccharide deacetylase family protein [Phycisphaera sp.]|nr:polysaccharide deacetylase family protein [Phycisphaera sp.]